MVAQKPLEDQLIGLSDQPGSHLEVHAEPTARWVRAVVDGVAVADSKQVLTVTMGMPVYYFPRGDVRADLLEASERRESHAILGERSFYDLRVGDRLIEDAAWRFDAPPIGAPDLGEHWRSTGIASITGMRKTTRCSSTRVTSTTAWTC